MGGIFGLYLDIWSFSISLSPSLSLSKYNDKLMDNLLVIICFIARAYRRLHTMIEIIISFTHLNTCVCVIVMFKWRFQ